MALISAEAVEGRDVGRDPEATRSARIADNTSDGVRGSTALLSAGGATVAFAGMAPMTELATTAQAAPIETTRP